MYGWVGQILRIDLTTRKFSSIPTSNYVPQFIGGRSLAAKIYWDEIPADVKAFDPENKLLFMTGPATGALAPSAKFCVTAKSPQTIPQCYQFSSVGGHWGAELKFSGYDGIIVQGKASAPVYVWICDREVEIVDAENLWGRTTSETDKWIRKKHGQNTRSMVIGPAGENLCGAAIISTDGSHTTGQGHFGAVMGSKKLKAIAVRGSGSIGIAEPGKLIENYEFFSKLTKPMPNTSMAYYIYNGVESLPERWRGVVPSDVNVWFDENSYRAHYLLWDEEKTGLVNRKWGGCFACPVCCDVAVQFKDSSMHFSPGHCIGLLNWVLQEGKKYNGKRIGRVTFEANTYFNDLGLSISNSLGFRHLPFLELVDAGILNQLDTLLTFDEPLGIEMIKKLAFNITYRKSEIWNKIADGFPEFMKKLARENKRAKAICEKWIPREFYYGSSGGMEPEDALGMLNSATSPRQRHNDPLALLTSTSKNFLGFLGSKEISAVQKAAAIKYFGSERALDLPGESRTFEGKTPVVVFLQNMQMDQDSVTYCGWAGFPKWMSMQTNDHMGDPSIGAKLYSCVTGNEVTLADMIRAGEIGWNVERCIQVREGRRKHHDSFSDAYFERGGKWTSRNEFKKVRESYYEARGWHKDTGIPKRVKLLDLGLNDVVEELERKELFSD